MSPVARRLAFSWSPGPGREAGSGWRSGSASIWLRPRDQVERPATALADLPGFQPPSPAAFLSPLAERFEAWQQVWSREGFAPVAEAWTRLADGLGGPCTARLPDRTLSGVAEALDGDGALRLRLDSGETVRITAGDVFFGGT